MSHKLLLIRPRLHCVAAAAEHILRALAMVDCVQCERLAEDDASTARFGTPIEVVVEDGLDGSWRRVLGRRRSHEGMNRRPTPNRSAGLFRIGTDRLLHRGAWPVSVLHMGAGLGEDVAQSGVLEGLYGSDEPLAGIGAG